MDIYKVLQNIDICSKAEKDLELFCKLAVHLSKIFLNNSIDLC